MFKQALIGTTCFLAGFLGAIGMSGNAEVLKLELEGGVGQAKVCCLTDGVWWQSQRGEFQGDLKPTTLELGARLRYSGYGLHAAYLDLGNVTSNNVATMRDDNANNYDPSQPCNDHERSNCLGTFVGSQKVKGVLAGLGYRFDYRGFGIEPELGYYFYRSKWNISIDCSAECGANTNAGPQFPASYTYRSRIQKTPYAALTLDYRGFFGAFRKFSVIDGNAEGEPYGPALTKGPASQFVIGYRVTL